MPVRTFKAIDNDLRWFGFWLPDLIVFVLAVFFPAAVLHLLSLTIVVAIVLAVILLAIRKRPAGYLRDLSRFVLLPGRYVIGYDEERFR